jgi:hypothetical protein
MRLFLEGKKLQQETLIIHDREAKSAISGYNQLSPLGCAPALWYPAVATHYPGLPAF